MKFSVTPELALLIKTLRAQSAVSAKSLAEALGKSPSYVSKLENGEVKSAPQEVVRRVLTVASGGGDFFEDVLPAAWRTLSSFLASDRLVAQEWLLQFDVVERRVTIPAAMAKDIKARLAEAGIELADLVAFAGRNVDSGLSAGVPANQVISVDYEGSARFAVRVEMDVRAVEQAFDQEIPVISYLEAYNVVFNMFRLLRHPGLEGKMPPEPAAAVLRCTTSYLDQWGLRTLIGFGGFISSDEFIVRQEQLASSSPRIAGRIADALEELSRHDSVNVTNQLNAFYETLSWDPAFALKVMSIPFSDLGQMGFRAKSRLLADIQELVERYDRMPDFQKKLEEY